MFNSTIEIEKYILDHTEPESELLKDLTRQTHVKILYPRMLSGHIQGRILKMITDMIRPKRVLEIGTYTGYSALCFAEGLSDDGKIHTIEINDEIVDFAQSYFDKSENKNKIQLHIGDALEIIPTINERFDLVFIDGDKRNYLEYYHAVFEKVNVGGYILADNVLWSGKVVEPLVSNDLYTKGILDFNTFVHNDSRVENLIFPIRDGIMILRKKNNHEY
ncbi:MAG: methyltransferase [Bacteroidetes bacterium GWF2_33_38]|nr:MAG: methyltransferase [Bacteroidetes bacterium GWF2_33_38]OFY91646.1 MAG: methyltransferase [Bacteroidetes bacterium RIFOXYA2_FULL_33_7]HBX50618.1 methyltransferase [Bacteroidales bacterium]